MVNYYIYARDCSFSTFNNEHYHTNGLKTLGQFKRDVENIKEEQLVFGELPESRIVYLHWGDDCWEVDEDETRTAYLELNCEQMGTQPEWIIQHLQKKYIIDENDKIMLLYIITDGLISHESVKKCFRLNEFIHYETVVFHAFNEDTEKIDISVAASFFKNRCMIYRNYKLYVSTDISKKFGYDRINAQNFASKKNELKSYIILKFINGFQRNAIALQEIEKLKKLRDRLLDELSLQKRYSEDIEVDPQTRDGYVYQFKFVDKDVKNPVITVTLKIDIQKSISSLINYIVSDAKSYSFDALTFTTLTYTQCEEFVQDEQINDVDLTTEQEFEIFDFILEDDVGIPLDNRILVNAT